MPACQQTPTFKRLILTLYHWVFVSCFDALLIVSCSRWISSYAIFLHFIINCLFVIIANLIVSFVCLFISVFIQFMNFYYWAGHKMIEAFITFHLILSTVGKFHYTSFWKYSCHFQHLTTLESPSPNLSYDSFHYCTLSSSPHAHFITYATHSLC